MVTITTQRALRAAFWQQHPRAVRRWVNGSGGYPIRPQNSQPTDTRVAWCDFVDACARNGTITEDLAQRATLA